MDVGTFTQAVYTSVYLIDYAIIARQRSFGRKAYITGIYLPCYNWSGRESVLSIDVSMYVYLLDIGTMNDELRRSHYSAMTR